MLRFYDVLAFIGKEILLYTHEMAAALVKQFEKAKSGDPVTDPPSGAFTTKT